MSESDPLLPNTAVPHRSLRNRMLGVFRGPDQDVAGESIHQGQVGGGSSQEDADARARLLESYYHHDPACGAKSCNHGTFSPRPEDGGESISSQQGFTYTRRIRPARDASNIYRYTGSHPESVESSGSSFLSQPRKDRKKLYLSYYIPFLNWIGQYRWSFFRGDLVAAITIASIYIPMALSLAANLAHAPPINGLYSFVINPLIYAILGSSPLLVVGPEAAGSLLVGTIVKTSVKQGHAGEDDDAANAAVVGVATAMAGAMILIAGITRLGFLDNVLSRPFLRGFITAIGFVIFVDQLIPELGLADLAKDSGNVAHGSTVDKLVFVVENIRHSHGLTTALFVGSFAISILFRYIKRWLEPRFPQVVYSPDRFLVVVLSAVLTYQLGWEEKGVEILGPMRSSTNGFFRFEWPFSFSGMKHVRTAMSTSFIIALLGFFESSVAAKGLGEGAPDGIKNPVSANREMVALGVANVVGGCFMALPAFGGYGRSKLNASTGARSPMSSILLSIITLVSILVLVPYMRYLPKAVLSSMISVVAVSLIEECPKDIAFFLRLRGWTELALMLLIFTSTIFYSLELGIALGIGLSILILIRHSTQPRIQILGKVPGEPDRFDNAELRPEKVVLIEGALIVKIPEPLTFANTGDLKNRLRRLELYGSNHTHPSLPRVRDPEHNKNMIFDVHGVTSIDGSGAQVLSEIVDDYSRQGVRVFFCRVPNDSVMRMFERSGIVKFCGGEEHFVPSVEEALQLAESETQTLEI
ncbi:hypothetical protein ASPZODRAFT_160996 [Penicilliopsis zonata CBS 506.65]|uniref:STAS domain-containing protein n=1 Tax=Penicilliopsis zonata CBS 506.65 TaxID=1073090 RepID=A0A1L9SB87_9EURO|nr:hypothetical protein ASPZODRAFT_160996 [Penicilliopsis zonata CBS 506.65]OJJ44406.1 hypothetical protein ASPZODRAFT_160996 [Penicilliopsis zonata CBS 506.65]